MPMSHYFRQTLIGIYMYAIFPTYLFLFFRSLCLSEIYCLRFFRMSLKVIIMLRFCFSESSISLSHTQVQVKIISLGTLEIFHYLQANCHCSEVCLWFLCWSLYVCSLCSPNWENSAISLTTEHKVVSALCTCPLSSRACGSTFLALELSAAICSNTTSTPQHSVSGTMGGLVCWLCLSDLEAFSL